jgi:hypothetical protein
MPPSTDSTNSSLQQLPHEVLVQVMRWLPQRDRVGACALTCRALLAAEVAATDTLEGLWLSQQRADAAAAWLARHGSRHLKELELCGPPKSWAADPPPLVSLALPSHSLRHLQRLQLSNMMLLTVQPAAAGSRQTQHTMEASCSCRDTVDHSSCSTDAALAGLTALTHLLLNKCDVTSLGVGATQLSALSTLQQLWMWQLETDVSVEPTSPAYSAAFGHMLGQLCQLTNLSLQARYQQRLLGTVLAAASSLSRLQHLNLECVGTDECAVMVQDLPASLTYLEMQFCALSRNSSSSSSNMRYGQLTALQCVRLECTDFPPAVLLHMPHVTKLDCHSCGEQRMAETLAALQHLQQLRELELQEVLVTASAAEYAALTASSQLQTLQLQRCSIAATAAEHMFTAGRPLPHLTQLCISPDEGWPEITDEAADWLQDPAGLRHYSLVVGPAHVGRLVACCPALQELGMLVLDTRVAATDLALLLQLTALTKLGIGGVGCDGAATPALAAMTGKVKTTDTLCSCGNVLWFCDGNLLWFSSCRQAAMHALH